MIFLALGVAFGMAVAVGPLGALHAPFDSAAAGLDQLAAVTLGALAKLFDGLPPELDVLVGVLLAGLRVAVPALFVALLGTLAGAAGDIAKKLFGVCLLAGAVAPFFVPAGQAVSLIVILGACAVAVYVAGGVAVPLVFGSVAAVIGTRIVISVVDQTNAAVGAGAAHMAAVSGSDAGLWQLILSVLAVAPLVLGVWRAIDR